ncbi:hypothetical protein V501_05368 [Pseudogymnoascus sp. VKM F-4519 (FW-2642)]|nr:hypothetical protein V501_05368 [Pseudogymnoascus sp. VKM F-4519 (FW-2642)]
MTATEAVFATFELLETILLSLPPLDILHNLAISRTWHQTIFSSTPLKQRLFLAPASLDTPWTQNPILAAKFWPIFHDFNRTGDLAEKFHDGCSGPSLNFHIPPPLRYLTGGTPPEGTMEAFTPADWEAYCRPEASWRRMLAMQPPVPILQILQHAFHQESKEETRKRGGPRKVMQLSQGRKADGTAPGVMQWDVWDAVDVIAEDDGGQWDESIYLIEGEEDMERYTLVYVDWWMDRKAPAMNNGPHVNGS